MKRILEGLGPLTLLIPFLAVAALYSQVADHGYIDFDDMYYTYENPMVSRGLSWQGVIWAFSGSHIANYHPLTWLSHMTDFSLFGSSPGAFALVNAGFHAANSILVALLIGSLFRSRISGVLAGLVFAVHPQLVEGVAWISQRKTVLTTFFALLTWILYLRALRNVGSRSRAWLHVFALTAYTLSLLAKGMFVTTPAVLLLLEMAEGDIHRKAELPGMPTTVYRALRLRIRTAALRLSPFVALSILFSLLTIWAQAADHAVHSIDSLSIGSRIATALYGYESYLIRFVYPADLSIFYPRSENLEIAALIRPSLILVAISLALVVLRKTVGIAAASGWFMFLILLLPVIGLIQVGEQASADRYMYGPIIGLLVAVTSLCRAALLYLPSRSTRLSLAVGAALWIGFCAIAAHQQVRLWNNSYSLAIASEKSVGPSAQVLAVQASILNRARLYAEALPVSRRGLELAPTHTSLLLNLAAAEFGVGNHLEAISISKHLISLAPELSGGRINLALYYSHLGQLDEASAILDELKPSDLTVSERRVVEAIRTNLENKKGKQDPASPCK